MSGFEFLFGRKNGGGNAPLGEKIKSSARSQLEGKIIRSAYNKWWLVLLRRYIVWPLIKLPFLPMEEALQVRRHFRTFDRAMDLLRNQGFKAGYSILPELSGRITGQWLARNFVALFKGVFWRPVGQAFAVEKHLCLKLFALTLVMWSVSIALYVAAVLQLVTEGYRPLLRDLSRLFGPSDILYALQAAQSGAFNTWLLSCGFWVVSLLTSFALASRPWLTLNEQVKEFLKGPVIKADEVDTKTTVLALPEMMFLSSPSITPERIRLHRSGWPGGFELGEFYESIKTSAEIVLIRKPEMPPPVFSGEYTSTDILSHWSAYDKHLLSKIKASIAKPRDPELIFLGEVIDNRWFRSSSIMLKLNSNPHLAVVGATRSGKTKGVLSFVFAFKAAYPDTVFYFADGKSSPDYDPFADIMSEYPVAKPDDKGTDPLIQFANLVEAVWSEYNRRKRIFDEARLAGKPCSTIYEYRDLVGPLPQVWLICDEFSVFNMELNFDQNFKTEGTIANRLKRLSAEAASYGIHLLFASQRYQTTDIPSVMRSNLTARMIYNVTAADAGFLEVPEATTLRPGQCFVTAAGLFCEFTGINRVKARLPYIGDFPAKLLLEKIEPIAREKKKQFDPYLVYNKGSDDIESLDINGLCTRLKKFFMDQHYWITDKVTDFEATDLQMEIVKGAMRPVKREDGTISMEIEKLSRSKRIGISVMKHDEVTADALSDLQNKYSSEYPAIIVFAAGKAGPTSKYKFVTNINEKGVRFAIVPVRQLYKDIRFLEMKRKEGELVDLIASKIVNLGQDDVSYADAARTMAVEQIVAKSTPVKLKIARILDEVKLLERYQHDDTTRREIPVMTTMLPGGTKLSFLILQDPVDKRQKENAKELADEIARERDVVVIVTNEKFAHSDIKDMETKRIFVWKTAYVDEILVKLTGDKAFAKGYVLQMMVMFHLIRPDGNGVILGDYAVLNLATRLSPDLTKVERCVISCATTGFSLLTIQDLDLGAYRMDELGIHDRARITVTDGVAPLDANQRNVTVRLSAKGRAVTFPPTSRYDVSLGVLVRRQAKISEADPLLSALKARPPGGGGAS